MASRNPNLLKSIFGRSAADKTSVRYAIAVFSAVFFLGWLVLELTQAF
jgi:hypothetical protein